MDILLFFIEVMMNVFAMTDLWLILYLLFGCDMKISLRNVVLADAIFFVSFVVISVVLEGHDWIIFAFMCLYNIAVTLLLCNSHRIRAVFLTVPAILVYSQFNSFLNLFEKIAGLEKYYLMNSDGHMQTVVGMTSDMMMCIVLVLLSKTRVAKTKSIQLTIGEGIVVSIFCMFSPVIVVGLEWFEGLVNAPAYRVVWVLFMIILNIAVIYAIAHRKRATYYRQLSEDYKKEFETEYSFFKDYKEQQKDTIKFRHDWKNHMLLLQEMLKKEEYEKAEEYFKELTKAVPESATKIATGNELVDIIVSTKVNVMEEYEITLQCKGDMAKLSFMKHMDLCSLLSNLLDNAIEANANVSGEKYILLQIKITGGAICLEMSNPMEGELIWQNNRIVSTKKEKEGHGIGLQNVFDIIKQYDGEYRITTKNNIYKIQMVFPG